MVILKWKIQRLVFQIYQLHTFWHPGSKLQLPANRKTHAVMRAWGLAPQLDTVVFTVMMFGVRIAKVAGVVDEVIVLQPLPNEIWIEILQYLR